MKRIDAIIRISKFGDVKNALREIGIDFFSCWDITGVGNEIKQSYRGVSFEASTFIPRQLLTLVVQDINLKKTIECIRQSARTGVSGDGRIFVTEIAESYKIMDE
jgi:nitrogen regulatory protein P-II 1